MKHTNTLKAAFSLVELMFVLAIMAVLAGVVALNLGGTADRAKIERTMLDLQTIANTLDLYEVKYNTYPPTSVGIYGLIAEGHFKSAPLDAWKQEFSYISPTAAFPDGYEVRSAGKDGQWDTIDDIIIDPSTEQ